MNELKIINTVPAKIEWDKEIALQEAKEIMAKYDGLEFSEDDLPVAKKEVATLRKVSKAINSQALAIDKELTASVKEFRSEVKEVKAIVDSGIDYINDQVKVFESKLAQERQEFIMSFDEWKSIKEHTQFDSSWLLKKWNDKDLKELFNAVRSEIDRANQSIRLLAHSHNLNSEFYVEKYKTIPVEQVLERIVEDATQIQAVETPNLVEEPIKVVPDADERIVTITRQLKGSVSALKILKGYAEQLGIEWIK